MWWVFSILMAAWIAYSSIQSARRSGTWKWSRFALTLGLAAVVCVVVTTPIFLIEWKLLAWDSPAIWPIFIGAWVVGFGAIIWFAIWAKRWTRQAGGKAALLAGRSQVQGRRREGMTLPIQYEPL